MADEWRGKMIYDRETGKMVPVTKPDTPRAPAVITDEIPGGIRSMADRKTYTSKSELRASYRRLGKIEIGDEVNYPVRQERDPNYDAQLERDIEESYYAVRDGNAPLSEFDRHNCEIINQQIRDSYDTCERDEFGNPIDRR